MGQVGISGGHLRKGRLPLEARPMLSWQNNQYLTCPSCRRLRWRLYQDDDGRWRCPACHWSKDCMSRHEARGDPARAAVLLRRCLGAELQFGAPLPPRPKGRAEGREYDRLVRRLAILEARAFNHLRRFAASFERLAERQAKRERP